MAGEDIYERAVQAALQQNPGQGVLEQIEFKGNAWEATVSLITLAGVTLGSALAFTAEGLFGKPEIDTLVRLFFGSLSSSGLFVFVLILNGERHFTYGTSTRRSKILSFAVVITSFLFLAMAATVLHAALRLGGVI